MNYNKTEEAVTQYLEKAPEGWGSLLSPEMTKHLSEDEREELFNALDDSVATICEEFGVCRVTNHEQVWGVLYPCLFEGHDSNCMEYIDKDGAVVHQPQTGAEEITGEQTVLCTCCKERETEDENLSLWCYGCLLDRGEDV